MSGNKDARLADRAARIRLLAVDVDGVLTGGGIIYGNDGEELKAFSIRDGLGMTVADASSPVAVAANWQNSLPGGRGAAREACEFLLTARGAWHDTVAEFR